MSLEYALQKNGFEVFIARDGQEALEILKNKVPDLVLLDIMMPNVDGYETLQKIKTPKYKENSRKRDNKYQLQATI